MAKVSLRAYNREIEAMIDRNHLDEAVAHCQHILKTFPKHVETYRLLGKAYLEARRHDEAVDIFTRVLAAVPNDFVAHVGMSIVRDEQNKLDDAIWHMERAYESQSANSAIQAELQRLYGRREGVQPPRVRMTRGALANMYMRGELYPQAISESKGVLEDDPGRSDMQVLLAKAYYRSGQKKDAADAASAVLKRYPFCLDANLVLAEILGTDRPESAQGYRQRVVELDPYTSQSDNLFDAAEVSDAAISLDRLDWNGQPAGMTADWRTADAISLESGISGRDEQPDWMKASYPDETPLSAPALDSGLDASSQPALPADDIPDFLKAAGWGASTGAFDESKSSAMFDEESAPAAEPLAHGDLPDWIKAMAPTAAVQPAEEQAEEIPDWINKIGTSELPVPSAESEETDWISGLGEPAGESQPSAEQPDWMKELGGEQPAPAPAAAVDDLDWLKDLDQEEQPVASVEAQSAPAAATDDLDWLTELGQEEQPVASMEEQPAPAIATDDLDWLKELEQPVSSTDEQPAPAATEDLDWLKGLEQDIQQPVSASEDQPDWLKGFGDEEQSVAASEDQPDWLKDFSAGEPVASSELDLAAEAPVPEVPAATVDTGSLGTSEKEQDDSFAWLEALAAKQGATEGLLTTPEERLEEEPDWVKQVKKGTGELKPLPESHLPAEEVAPVEPEPVAAFEEQIPVDVRLSAPTASVEELGKSEAERDDAFAWLEALAAKQGASEGLLTKPEERLEQEPDWVQQVKKGTGELQPLSESQPPVEEAAPAEPEPVAAFEEQIPAEEPFSAPTASVEELGKSEAERDDAFAWLEALAAKQGASEGLLTKPEERLEQEPDWVQQVKKGTGELQPLSESQPPVEEAAPAEPEPFTAFEEPIPAEEPVFAEPVASLETQLPVEEAAPAEPEPLPVFEEQTPVEEIVIPEPELRLEQPESVEDTQPTRVQRPVVEEQAAPAMPEPVSALEGQIPVEEISAPEPEPISPPVSSVEELGKSEGLLTKPEERQKEEPEWVKRLKSAGNALKSALAQPAKEETAPEPAAEVEQAPVTEEAVPAEPEPVSALEAQPPVAEVAPTEPEPVSALEEQPVEETVVAEPEPASQPMANVEELGKSDAERDDSFAWLEALAARQGATEGLLTKPEERLEDAPEWVKQAKELREEMPAPAVTPPAEPEPEPEPLGDEIAPAEDVPAWVKGLGEVEEEESEPEPITEDETTAWLRSLDEPEEAEPVTLAPAEDLPAWMQEIEREEEAPAAEPAVPTMEAEVPAESPAAEELPAWLHGLVEDEQPPAIPVSDDLPAWMRDETGEVVAEPTKIEPTRSTDWAPLDETAEAVEPPPPAPQPAPQPKAAPAPKAKKPAKKETVKPAVEPYREPITAIRGTGMLSMPVDPILASARAELTRSNIPGALDTYGKLIKKGRFLEEVIFDLREALYRYPVEVSIWQALGDAYMRANRLQDALDAYTKAEELLR